HAAAVSRAAHEVPGVPLERVATRDGRLLAPGEPVEARAHPPLGASSADEHERAGRVRGLGPAVRGGEVRAARRHGLGGRAFAALRAGLLARVFGAPLAGLGRRGAGARTATHADQRREVTAEFPLVATRLTRPRRAVCVWRLRRGWRGTRRARARRRR